MMKAFVTALTVVLVTGALYAKEYHVSPAGSDMNPGSKSDPFKTISAAAQVAQPGDVVTVHAGVYRERVNPPRGGTSDAKRIVYQAALGERVMIKGSEVVKDWEKMQNAVWKVTLPNSFFGAFNPYTDVIGGEWYNTPRDGFNRHTGAIYVNGHWLDEAPTLSHVVGAPQAGSKDRVLGGRTAGYAGQAINKTEEDRLYQTCRYNMQGYHLAVPNGTYRVTLKFCEPHFAARGKRIFDVKLQDRTFLKHFDIFAEVGQFTAHDETFDGIEVTDGRLNIDIMNRVSMACISGIVVDQEDYRKQFNCGGPAWKDYQPDPGSITRIAHDRALWYAKVDQETTTIWAQFKAANPNKETVEINVRQSIFYPDQPRHNYITVRGFTMSQAATPWSGAMSEQIGLIGTHWSKGWIIEDNRISHSMNTGITLGRYDLGQFGIAMPPATAPGFVRSCELALEHGWCKETIGSHVVRNNHISHCEKNGIHGSLGGIFSRIEGNTICDIAIRGWINGPDVAGLKLLGSLDTLIRDNHIYRCKGSGGVWLDWMAQGTHFTGNLLHDNSRDLFAEVNHGPFLIDHNLLLSSHALQDWSQGGAYVHNLIAGFVGGRKENRKTPFFRLHTVKDMQLSNIQHRDLRFHNNLFVGPGGLSGLAETAEHLQAVGNLYLAGAKPSTQDRDALILADLDPGITLQEKPDGWWLEMAVDSAWTTESKRSIVTTELLGRARIPNAPFEHPDGTTYRLDTDHFGKKRNKANPTAGPFETSGKGPLRLKLWPRQVPSDQATVVIDTDATAKPYDPMIFGGFLEHFGRQVYGGVFEPGSLLADDKGFRLDVIAALKELKVPVIRWPGGCFVDAYHWQKGVGDKRQPYGDFRWGVIESNQFGTDEFLEFCQLIGAEPYICHNGLSSVQENLDWVAYCNATEGKFAEMRKKNGHPEPFNVKFWSVGNERYDKAYIHRVRDTAKAMKALYPNVQVTCSGSQGGQGTRMRGIHDYLMEQAGKYLDYVSVHNYWLPRANQLPRYDYMTAIAKSEMPDAYMTIVSESLGKAGMDRIKIAFDEWNLRAWQHPGFPRNTVEDYEAPDVRALVERRVTENAVANQYTMADALFAASFFNACLRHSENVTMANIAPLVNTRGLLFVHPKGIVKRTHFHSMAMYANGLQARVAHTQVTAGTLTHGTESVAVVDAIATVDTLGKNWAIALVNRHPSDSVACTIKMKERLLEGDYEATVLTGESPDAYNDIEHPNRVVPRKTKLTLRQGVVTLPAHSLVIMDVPAERL